MRRTTKALSMATLSVLAFIANSGVAATLEVGPGKAYSAPCQAFKDAKDGDIVDIDAAGNGTYDGDVCAIAANGLTIRGVGGRAHIDAAGQNAQGKAIWVVQGNDTTIENVELSGATVPDLNGAGIRAEGTNLTIRGSYFHDDQDGILGGAGVLLIETSEFAKNGNCLNPAGCAHNMYISNAVTKFTLRYSYSHDVTDGHLVKSRAQTNYILYNRLTGEAGTDSYELSLPNAGTTYVIGNLIEQGPNTGNPAMLDYGSEGPSNAGNDLYVVNNTFVNDRASGGTFVSIDGRVTAAASVKNNIFFGKGTQVSQATASLANNFAGDPLLVNASAFDYHLKPASPCIDAGANPGSAPGGFALLPISEYVDTASFEARVSVGVIDVGAYEFGNTATGGTDRDGSAPIGVGGALGTKDGGDTTAGGSGGSANSGSGGTSTTSTPGTGGASHLGGSVIDAGTSPQSSRDSAGCGCRTADSRSDRGAQGASGFLAALVAAFLCRRSKREP